ncbi:unnamed protein product, partial [Prorocentrum cordatum]
DLQRKVTELKRRLQQRRSAGEALSDRAEAALAGRRQSPRNPSRRRRGSDGSNSGESSFDGAPRVDAGRRIAHLVRDLPGALLSSGMEQIKRYLARRGGADPDQSLGELAANVAQYITSAWHGHHPQSEMGVRNVREMRAVGECLDGLRAMEQATKDGHWQVARHRELRDDHRVGLARQEEVHDAVRKRRQLHGLAERVTKAKKGG